MHASRQWLRMCVGDAGRLCHSNWIGPVGAGRIIRRITEVCCDAKTRPSPIRRLHGVCEKPSPAHKRAGTGRVGDPVRRDWGLGRSGPVFDSAPSRTRLGYYGRTTPVCRDAPQTQQTKRRNSRARSRMAMLSTDGALSAGQRACDRWPIVVMRCTLAGQRRCGSGRRTSKCGMSSLPADTLCDTSMQ